jgi:hypothetical protein
MVGLVPTIHPTACSGMDLRAGSSGQARDDNEVERRTVNDDIAAIKPRKTA